MIEDILDILNISVGDLLTLRRSNDRSNVAIVVREIKSSLTSLADLDFLVRRWASGGPPPPKFLVLFDNMKESVNACHRLREMLPLGERDKIKWHNSNMSTKYRSDALDEFRADEVIGFFATDTLGMVSSVWTLVIYWLIHRLIFPGYGHSGLSNCCSMACGKLDNVFSYATAWKSWSRPFATSNIYSLC